jgi:FtsZ-interacting cell division protein YlmF
MTPGNSVSTPKEAGLDRLLGTIEERVDLDHCREVDQRCRATLACEPVGRPPWEELLNGHARRRFPTGMVFTFEPRDFNDAREVVETFRQT